MSQQHRSGRVATTVLTEDGVTRVVYHQTKVVSFDQNTIKLNTGGWRSATTKTRMNQASNQFELGFVVYQKNLEWFVDFKGETIQFEGKELTLIR